MPAQKKYDVETQERAVRMFTDRFTQGNISQIAAPQETGKLLGINPSTLKNWVRRSNTSSHTHTNSDGQSCEVELVRLRRENWGCQMVCVRLVGNS
jgi:transposase